MFKEAVLKNWMWKKEGKSYRSVDLPHDAMQYEMRHAKAAGGGGGAYYEGGIYYYEKTFEVPSEWSEKHLALQFEGVYCNSTVFVNGTEAAHCPYGYVPFWIDLDQHLKYGETNTILVKVQNDQMPNTRWYSGSGIYRPVWLWQGEKTYIRPESVQIRTLEIQPAKVQISCSCVGEYDHAEIRILDGTKLIYSENVPYTPNAELKQEITLEHAELWDEVHPKLYTCEISLIKADRCMDTAAETFGIRKISWSSQGLFVNGVNTLLRGGCVHHDNGVIGARTYAESEWRRVELLKKAGYNAIRVSHNPASTQMLAACDYYGMYVMDEGWDMWYKHKNKYDYATYFMDHYESDIEAMVSRDFNHPSVILYSIGNEVSEPASGKGIDLAEKIIAKFHALDPDRPVSGGMNLMIISRSAQGNDIYKEGGGRSDEDSKKNKEMNSMMFNIMTSLVGSGMNKAANGKKADRITTPVLDALDIAGYNYASGRYPLEGKAHPNRIIYGSETFPQDIAKNWKMVKKYPYLIGDFMWTAWDYIGEAGAGAWAYTADGRGFEKPFPWLLADMGVMDILGTPNGELYFANAAWEQLTKPVICVQPVNHPGVKPFKSSWRGTNSMESWSWKDCTGNRAVVEVYANAEFVTLFLNEKKIGKKKLKDGKAVFKMKYLPGTLRAVAKKNGIETEASLVSASAQFGIHLAVEEKRYPNDPIYYVDVTIADEDGIVESNADDTCTVSIEHGKVLGFGSANPRTTERFQNGIYTTYYGRSQVVVEVEPGETAVLTVSSKRFGEKKIQIANLQSSEEVR